VTTTARREGAGWKLQGQKVVVLDGPSADLLVVLARTGGAQRDPGGLSLFLVPADAAGVNRRDYRTIDRRRAADIAFDTALPAEALITAEGAAWPVVEAAVDRALAALASEAVGCMKVLHEDTLAYLKVRKQFGQELANFQVLQHRMVDMMIALEQAKSLAMAAAIRVDEGDPVQRAKACAAAKVQAGRAGRFVGQQAIQLHGGMGMTDELRIGHYYKRLMAIETLFGDADWHQRRFADLSLAA
jgi:alkylation response protein AidB-like acyl-CoA dehydrogenase